MANRGYNPKEKKKDDKNKNKGMTEYILENAIPCGYLLKFCNIEHNSENLRFAMEVEEFKENHSDPSVWTKSWQELDIEKSIKSLGKELTAIELNGDCHEDECDENNWPSTKVDRIEMKKSIQAVWDSFLSDDSPTQICLSQGCMRRTQFRINHLHLYGPEIFGEAMIDPIKTINKDIMPRFQKAALYQDMNKRMAHVDPLPAADTLEVESPDESYVMDPEWMAEVDKHNFTLEEMLQDMYLYQIFLEYLEENNAAQHLLCVRMIQIFEDHILAKDIPSAIDQAWELYKYFIATGSAYEVPCTARAKKDIMLNLARCASGDFEHVRKVSYGALVTHFANFQNSPTFSELPAYMKKSKRNVDKKTARANGVFGAFVKK
mmetsp:Transcript_23153/g.23364  ORF Transcript_23153/g.23364 Transcript_23153/m.23364 type:complete len:377 (-) Transcript_23153:285-1415(-)|eukprot:CAMPEP_0182427956 /NCGR_PEP_ID=MMETSP1167-20130531/20916_1 /TAXON_ID=2988 /ORGANISM="Mallomonas Sp, Strain CCMP3275" /LENGTH=376 /DNA_ID=CAMNT_0024610567 /DNA_START=145 /DNA_END=1275 /DNA_ORIENTATION=-